MKFYYFSLRLKIYKPNSIFVIIILLNSTLKNKYIFKGEISLLIEKTIKIL